MSIEGNSTLFYFLLFSAGFSASLVSIFAGMAGGAILLAALSFFLPASDLIPLHGAILIFSNLSRVYLMRSYIKKNIIVPYAIGTVIGALICTFFFIQLIPEKWALLLIGGILLWMLLPEKFIPLKFVNLNKFGFLNLGAFVGALGLIVGSVGALVSPFLLHVSSDKNEVVATKSALQVFTHLVKIPAFLFLGFSFFSYWQVLLVGCLSVWIGNECGMRLLQKVDEKIFIFIFKIFILAAALRFISQAFGFI